MTAPHGERTDAAHWLPKREAAKLLGLSVREVERKAAAGRIRTRKERLPGENADRALYHEEDVLTLKLQREQGTETQALARPSLAPTHAEAQMAVARSQTDAWASLAAHLAKLSAAFPPPQTKAWLTLAEASAYSGLPASQIAQLLRDCTVLAIGRGPRTWRVQRASLDAFGQLANA